MSQDNHRIIGNSEQDVMIGRLIEQTIAVKKQSEQMDATLISTNRTLSHLNITIVKLQGLVDRYIAEHERHLRESHEAEAERKKAHNDLCDRVDRLEHWNEDVKFVRGIRIRLNKAIAIAIVAGIMVLIVSAKIGWPFKIAE